MKSLLVTVSSLGRYLAAAILTATAIPALADFPVITIEVTNPNALAPDSPGVLTVRRVSSTLNQMSVFLQVSGAAALGTDYTLAPSNQYKTNVFWVDIQSGQDLAQVLVVPIQSSPSTNIKTITATIVRPSGPIPQIINPDDPNQLYPPNYLIGNISNATVNVYPPPPTIAITAPDPTASFQGDTGTFLVQRSGASIFPISVILNTGGTAQPWADYTFVPDSANWGFVNMYPGIGSVPITVVPNPASPRVTGQTVGLQIRPAELIVPLIIIGTNPPMFPSRYAIGNSSNAVVTITGNPSNVPPPVVTIVDPTNGETFSAPATIPITADVSDNGDYIQRVSFFANGKLLASFLLDPLPGGNTGKVIPATYQWPDVAAGDYALTVVARNTRGAGTVSDPVNIHVITPPPIPVVTLVATDPNASVTGDPGEFTVYRAGDTNNQLLVFYGVGGTASNGVDYSVLPGTVIIPAGATSVTIPVLPVVDTNPDPDESVVVHLIPSPLASPPTTYVIGQPDTAAVIIRGNMSNLPPVVTIFAPDPVAVEGTNCICVRPATVFSNFCSGTNTATFLVRRVGDTNSDLTVYYSIGGTASNGVDYATIPDNVTIAGGKTFGLITIVPLDDLDPTAHRFDTVVLTLVPSPVATVSNPPPYFVGIPRRAAAIILEDWNLPGPPRYLKDGSFHVSLPGADGLNFCLQTSSNMADWLPLCTNTVVKGSIQFVDPDAAGAAARYYRAVPTAGPPVF